MADFWVIAGVVVAFLAMVTGSVAMVHQLRRARLDDREKAAERLNERIDKAVQRARESERGRCDDRVAQMRTERDQARADLAEMTKDRDVERARADTLQNLINERGLGGRPR